MELTSNRVSARQAYLALTIVGLALTMLAPGIGTLIAAQALCGIGSGMALPSIYGLAPQMAREGEESRAHPADKSVHVTN